jgi:hypothetical protein
VAGEVAGEAARVVVVAGTGAGARARVVAEARAGVVVGAKKL